MSSLHSFSTGKGAGQRRSYVPPVAMAQFPTQAAAFHAPHYPFQPLPKPKDPAPTATTCRGCSPPRMSKPSRIPARWSFTPSGTRGISGAPSRTSSRA